MNPVFSVKKVLKDAFAGILDNFSVLFFRMLQMYAYMLLLALPVMFLFGSPVSVFSWQGVMYSFHGHNLYGIAWPMSWAIGSIIVFICYANLHLQYQRFVWRALHNQEIPSFRLKDFSLSAFGLALLISLIIMSGYICLVLPGLYFSVRFGYAYTVFAVENLSIIDSLRRSWHLTSGHVMKLLGLTLLSFAIRPLHFIAYPFLEAITVSSYKQLVDVGNRH